MPRGTWPCTEGKRQDCRRTVGKNEKIRDFQGNREKEIILSEFSSQLKGIIMSEVDNQSAGHVM